MVELPQHGQLSQIGRKGLNGHALLGQASKGFHKTYLFQHNYAFLLYGHKISTNWRQISKHMSKLALTGVDLSLET